MRLSILAFAIRIVVLQFQEAFPAPLVLGGSGALAVPGIFICSRQKHRLFRLFFLSCFIVLGVVWAGWMGQLRLSEQLPEALELREIEITGVVASLPQHFERGERFAFDVESVQTKGAVVSGHIMLSWYRGWNDRDDSNAGG